MEFMVNNGADGADGPDGASCAEVVGVMGSVEVVIMVLVVGSRVDDFVTEEEIVLVGVTSVLFFVIVDVRVNGPSNFFHLLGKFLGFFAANVFIVTGLIVVGGVVVVVVLNILEGIALVSEYRVLKLFGNFKVSAVTEEEIVLVGVTSGLIFVIVEVRVNGP